MATTIDHLSIDHVIHVIQEFTDARGVLHRVGERGLLVGLAYNMISGEMTLTWERDGAKEEMLFLRSADTGPGNGRMKQYFEKGEYVAAPIEGRRLIPGYGYAPLAPALPEVTPELITTAKRFDEGMERVWALAGRQRFDEAEEQLLAVVNAPDRRGENNDIAARSLCAKARLHAFDTDLTVYHWLRDRGISLWYSWGAMATSGGEGGARAMEIRSAECDFTELEKRLGR